MSSGIVEILSHWQDPISDEGGVSDLCVSCNDVLRFTDNVLFKKKKKIGGQIYSFVFISQIFTMHLLGARHCSRYWGPKVNERYKTTCQYREIDLALYEINKKYPEVLNVMQNIQTE